MITPDEIRSGVVGTLHLFRGDAGGMRYFDVSTDGFFRSFGVFLLLLVPFVVAIAAQRLMILSGPGWSEPADFPLLSYFLAQLAAFGAVWVGFPLTVAAMAKPLGLAKTFVPFIVARNWSSLIAVLPFVVINVLYLVGLIDGETVSGLYLFALGFNLYISYQVTRFSAKTPMGMTFGLVALEFALTVLFGILADRLVNV
jgi:hypothetical protein